MNKISIPTKIREDIYSLAQRYYLPEEEITSEVITRATQIAKDEEVTREHILKAFRLTRLKIKRRAPFIGKSETIVGRVLGTVLIDIKDLMRRRARAMWRTNQEEAIARGYTDEEGNPLDYRRTLFPGTKREVANPDFGKPIIGHTWQRKLFGVAKRLDVDSKELLFTGYIRREEAVKFPVEQVLYKTIKFRSTVREDGDRLIFPRIYTETIQEVDDEINWEHVLKGNITPLGEMYSWHETNKEDQNRLFITVADVVSVSAVPHPESGARRIVLDDESIEAGEDCISGLLMKDTPLNFGDESRIYIIGNTTPRREGSVVILEVYGAIPLKEYKTDSSYIAGEVPDDIDILL